MPEDVKTELRDALGKCRVQRIRGDTGRDLDFIFLFCQIARGAGTRTGSGREGAGAGGHAVDLVAEEEFRRRHRPLGKYDLPERA